MSCKECPDVEVTGKTGTTGEAEIICRRYGLQMADRGPCKQREDEAFEAVVLAASRLSGPTADDIRDLPELTDAERARGRLLGPDIVTRVMERIAAK